VASFLLADNTHRGTGAPPPPPSAPSLKGVSLPQSGARDFDPLGNNHQEHPADARRVVDGETNTSWSTETYNGGDLGKAGVGIYVDAKPDVAARAMEIVTPTKGWHGEVYVARNGSGPPQDVSKWQKLGTFTADTAKTKVDLDTATNRYRYYLVWITKLPPGQEKVAISEIRLFR
jgi:hypothetical protein